MVSHAYLHPDVALSRGFDGANRQRLQPAASSAGTLTDAIPTGHSGFAQRYAAKPSAARSYEQRPVPRRGRGKRQAHARLADRTLESSEAGRLHAGLLAISRSDLLLGQLGYERLGTNVTTLSPALSEPGQGDGPSRISGPQHRRCRPQSRGGNRKLAAHDVRWLQTPRPVYLDREANARWM